jgi:tRNA G18 (ribose-2'-O)-methylase SpoU
MAEIVTQSARTAQDPGLRDRYPHLPRLPLRILCCPLDKGINHGNILRIAECFRIEKVVYSPVSAEKEKDLSGGFAALKWQPFEWAPIVEAIREAKAAGYVIYGLTLSPDALPIQSVEWQFPCALVVGRELDGLDPEAEALCDQKVAIPLYGMVESLNVAVATGIAVSRIADAYRQLDPSFLPARSSQQALLRKEP